MGSPNGEEEGLGLAGAGAAPVLEVVSGAAGAAVAPDGDDPWAWATGACGPRTVDQADDLQRILRPEGVLAVPGGDDLPHCQVEVEGVSEDLLAAPDQQEPGVGRLPRRDLELVVGIAPPIDVADAAGILVSDDERFPRSSVAPPEAGT